MLKRHMHLIKVSIVIFKTIAADVFVNNVNHTSSLVKSKSICTVKKCEGVSIRKHSILQDHLMSKSFSITETTRF